MDPERSTKLRTVAENESGAAAEAAQPLQPAFQVNPLAELVADIIEATGLLPPDRLAFVRDQARNHHLRPGPRRRGARRQRDDREGTRNAPQPAADRRPYDRRLRRCLRDDPAARARAAGRPPVRARRRHPQGRGRRSRQRPRARRAQARLPSPDRARHRAPRGHRGRDQAPRTRSRGLRRSIGTRRGRGVSRKSRTRTTSKPRTASPTRRSCASSTH